jgi:hypothetical protein
MRGFVILAFALTSPALLAQEPDVGSVRNVYDYYVQGITEQCNSVKEMVAELKPDADPLQAYTLKDSVQNLCVCTPAQLEVFRATLTERDLSRHVTEEQFLASIKPYVFEKCAAEQLRAMYGSQCKKRFKVPGLDVASYCACMNRTMNAYTESQAAEVAFAAADYIPRAALAEQLGEPIPERPPVLQGYSDADQNCKNPPKADPK